MIQKLIYMYLGHTNSTQEMGMWEQMMRNNILDDGFYQIFVVWIYLQNDIAKSSYSVL